MPPPIHEVVNAHSRDLIDARRRIKTLEEKVAMLERRLESMSDEVEQVPVTHFPAAIDPLLTVESDGEFEEN